MPLGADVEVFDKKGKQIIFTQSPDTVTLRASAGYFKRAEYTIKVSKVGYFTKIEPIYFILDKKYIDNVFWLQFMPIGLLLIDPVSGAMWKPEKQSIEILLNPMATD